MDGGRGSTALGRIDVETCCTRGARSRRWFGGGEGGSVWGGMNWRYGMDG